MIAVSTSLSCDCFPWRKRASTLGCINSLFGHRGVNDSLWVDFRDLGDLDLVWFRTSTGLPLRRLRRIVQEDVELKTQAETLNNV